MSRAAPALAGLLLLAACHKREADTMSLDAGADQRNQTAAKTLADLDAADRAARTPAARND